MTISITVVAFVCVSSRSNLKRKHINKLSDNNSQKKLKLNKCLFSRSKANWF